MDFHPQESATLRSISKIMLILACFVVVVFGMREASEIITPILLAFILSIIFTPLQRWLLDRGVPAWLALIIVLLVMLLVLSVLVSLTVVSITQFVNRIPEYEESLQTMIDGSYIFLEDMSQRLPFDVSGMLALETFDFSPVFNIAGGLLGTLVDTFSNWIIVVLLVAFMMVDFAVLPTKMDRMFKDQKEIQVFSDLLSSIRRYVSITSSTGLLTGVANAVLCVILGVDFAILWGVVGFFMNYIPNLGIWLSILPPAILTLLEFGWQRAVIVIIGFWLTNVVIENILKPRVMGEDLNISPLFIMISLVVWTFVLGPMGSILAVPLTLITTKLLLENSEETRWLAVLMTANSETPDKAVLDKEE